MAMWDAQRSGAGRSGPRVWKITERSLMHYESRWNEAVKSNNKPMDRRQYLKMDWAGVVLNPVQVWNNSPLAIVHKL
jgi:hypothetical protein